MSSDKTDLRISAAPSVGGGSGKLEPDLVWQWVKSMTASRRTAQRLGGEFPTVSPNVIQAAVAQARAELHPLLADSLTEMTELLARERIRRATRSMNGRRR